MADNAIFSSFRRPPQPTQPASAASAGPARTAVAEPPDIPPPPPPAPVPTPLPDKPAVVEPEAVAPADGLLATAESGWADLSAISLGNDQLGLANPTVIDLSIRLQGSSFIAVEASTAGIYRPTGFRPAPWIGFAYDEARPRTSGVAAGTRILTARGEVEVERLVPGDSAMTLRDRALLRIASIGRTAPETAPVRVEPGALGPDFPRRTLYLGPEQTVLTQAVPVPIRTLVNGTTVRIAEATVSDLFHIDVGRAEVLFAEGLAISSSHRASQRA